MRKVITSIIIGGLGSLITFFFCLLALTARIFFVSPEKIRKLAPLWAKVILSLTGTKISVIGRENIILNGPQLFLANHQGAFDIPALLYAIPTDFLWIAKRELFFIPFFGQALKVGGYIPINRRDYKKASEGLKKASQYLRKGISLVGFPEGTRSPNGKLLPFKKGMFFLALETQVPIVPTTIIGSYQLMPKGSMTITPGKITVIFDQAINTKELSFEDCEYLRDKVRKIIITNLKEAF